MEETTNKAIGSRIRKHRELLGYTREQFAEKLDISSRFAADIELGNRGMSIETLIKICELFSVSADYILLGKNEESDKFKIEKLISCIDENKLPYVESMLKAFIKAMNEDKK